MCSQGISEFYLHTHAFIRNRNEPYLPLPSHLQLVLTYRPRRDARLSCPGSNPLKHLEHVFGKTLMFSNLVNMLAYVGFKDVGDTGTSHH